MKPEAENNQINLVTTIGLTLLRILSELKAILFFENNWKNQFYKKNSPGQCKSKWWKSLILDVI